ncbi:MULTISPECIES: hypothetical protein [Micrococcaceae]|uniref:hypothetical protein n=1 Tax=Micrococcaceae TaxID=1268 RepID=UPI000BB78155|nr:hypothetical protein [Glutamicibacter sp. BW78]PCC24874.1 hypothetical protein CIK75_12025 [Glutamicibacter sp. BW78]
MPQPDPLASPATAHGWLELAYDRAYSEDHPGAARAAAAGLDILRPLLTGSPAAPAPEVGPIPAGESPALETALSLLGVLASVQQLDGNLSDAEEAAARRIVLLRAAQRTHQADLEEHLGGLLFREPLPEETAILQAALATHAASGASADVLADARLPLAVVRFEGGDEAALEELQRCADDYRDGGRPESEAGALLYLAHGFAKHGRQPEAIEAADRLLALQTNLAMRAAIWMVKASCHHELGHPVEAEGCAVEALELYSVTGVRRGAISAAALVANFASADLDQDAAITAWRIAVEQAERGEFEETWAIRLALGNQLLEAEEFLLAEEVLESLAHLLQARGREDDAARTLMSLGHCLRHQDREVDALQAWEKAAAGFEASGLAGDAARAHLSAGTLLSDAEDPGACLGHFSRATELARACEDDPTVLPVALHAYGHALSESGDPAGLVILAEAIKLADEDGADWHQADFRDTRARSLWALNYPTEAVAAALEAADLFRVAEDTDGAGNAELFAAHVLSQTDRGDEAVQLYRLIAAEHRQSVAHFYAAQRGLSEALTTMELPVQAKEAADLANRALVEAQETYARDDEDPEGEAPENEEALPETADPADPVEDAEPKNLPEDPEQG